jgi:hypothetical protein
LTVATNWALPPVGTVAAWGVTATLTTGAAGAVEAERDAPPAHEVRSEATANTNRHSQAFHGIPQDFSPVGPRRLGERSIVRKLKFAQNIAKPSDLVISCGARGNYYPLMRGVKQEQCCFPQGYSQVCEKALFHRISTRVMTILSPIRREFKNRYASGLAEWVFPVACKNVPCANGMRNGNLIPQLR